jgi:hypothetical protein
VLTCDDLDQIFIIDTCYNLESDVAYDNVDLKIEILDYAKTIFDIYPTKRSYDYIHSLSDLRILYDRIGLDVPLGSFNCQLSYTNDDIKWAIECGIDKLPSFWSLFMHHAIRVGDFYLIDILISKSIPLPYIDTVEWAHLPGLISRGIPNPEKVYTRSVDQRIPCYSSKILKYVKKNLPIVKQVGFPMPVTLSAAFIILFNEIHNAHSYIEYLPLDASLLAIPLIHGDTYLLKLLANRITHVTPSDSKTLYWSAIHNGNRNIWMTGISWLDRGITKINETRPNILELTLENRMCSSCTLTTIWTLKNEKKHVGHPDIHKPPEPSAPLPFASRDTEGMANGPRLGLSDITVDAGLVIDASHFFYI